MYTNLMTIAERTSDWHRSPIIIHQIGGMYYIAEFVTVDQLDFFAQTLGFTYTETDRKETEHCGTLISYRLSHQIITGINDCLFWNLNQLPEGAKPIKALSNGSIVTCYFTNDGKTIRIYRPNPNAKDVYKPLNLDDHLAHRRIYGSY